MALIDKLKKETIKDLEQLDILMIDEYARRKNPTLKFLYTQGIIDDTSIESALEVAVFNEARTDYARMTAKGRYYKIFADHVGRPDCLAYALEKGQFSKEEIKNIPFDHGHNLDKYIHIYSRKNLLSNLKEELLNPKPPLRYENATTSHSHFICSNLH